MFAAGSAPLRAAFDYFPSQPVQAWLVGQTAGCKTLTIYIPECLQIIVSFDLIGSD